MDPQSDAVPGQSAPLPPVNGVAAVPGQVEAMPPQLPITQVAPTTAPQPAPVPADEPSDVLDEEWVQKAKDIVERTKDDPFQATKELSKMKADYLKVRFNKDTKIAEDSA